jgi:flavin reductase (DIM6/NTAB) family NADH-FMN oxidoreductase RutF
MVFREIFSLLLTGITPRPIALVSTRGADGVDNIAPFRFVRDTFLVTVH